MSKALCLIPAKGCSTRLARKNLLPLDGEPLIVSAIKKTFAANIFDTICVSTEDEEIASIAHKVGAEVPFLRPEKLSRDPATIVDVMLHALGFYRRYGTEFDKVCVILPTTPFVQKEDIQQANKLFDSRPHMALLSVCEAEFPPFNAWLIEEKQHHSLLEPCFPDSSYRYTKST